MKANILIVVFAVGMTCVATHLCIQVATLSNDAPHLEIQLTALQATTEKLQKSLAAAEIKLWRPAETTH